MANRRVQEVAKELEVDRQELVSKINELELGFSVNNYMSRLSPDEVERVKDALEDEVPENDGVDGGAEAVNDIGPTVIRRGGEDEEEEAAEAEAEAKGDEAAEEEETSTESKDEDDDVQAEPDPQEQQPDVEAADEAERVEAKDAADPEVEETDTGQAAETQDQEAEAEEQPTDEDDKQQTAEQVEDVTEAEEKKQEAAKSLKPQEDDDAKVVGQIDQDVVLDRLSSEGKDFKKEKEEKKKKDKKSKKQKKSGKRVVEGNELYDGKSRPKNRRNKQNKNKSSKPQQPEITEAAEHKRVIEMEDVISVGDLAHEMGKKAGELAMTLLENGMQANVNTMLDYETAALVADEYGYSVENVAFDIENFLDTSDDSEEDLEARPPVVTVMGHVDHGKTSLLDAIRKSDVTAEEEGGITQHIGAYMVNTGSSKLTFIDTPGHKAFTQLRARGAQVTDLVILVIAADDGVMPQTVEAINHARDAGVPIIVALNKMDLPQANPDRAKQALTEYELIPEEWGGTTLFVEVSALEEDGIDDLLETISLQAELEELNANPQRDGRGVVIESELDKGRGPVATVLVQEGTLHRGDIMVSGQHYGHVRTMHDYRGNRVEEAGPSLPVEVTGLSGVPEAGEPWFVVETEDDAQEVSDHVEEQRRKEDMASRAKEASGSLEDISKMIQQGDLKELNVIIKGDVQGSVEALKEAFEQIGNEEAQANVIHAGVGAITENDVNLAASSEEATVLVGFNVRPDSRAAELAEEFGIKILTHSVIYDAIDQVRNILEGLLEPDLEERVLGRAEVREVFSTPNAGNVAGCYVEEGVVKRNAQARLLRDNQIVTDTEIASLKRFQEDVKEVQTNYECGIGLAGYNDIKIGDVIEVYHYVEVRATLD